MKSFNKKIKKLYSNFNRGRLATNDPKESSIRVRFKYNGARYMFIIQEDDGYIVGVNYAPYCSKMTNLSKITLRELKLSLIKLIREKKQSTRFICVEIKNNENLNLFNDLF